MTEWFEGDVDTNGVRLHYIIAPALSHRRKRRQRQAAPGNCHWGYRYGHRLCAGRPRAGGCL